MTNRSRYLFDHAAGSEVERLIDQARVIDPITERFLREAGIGPGMRILDVGSGAGDVSLVASRIVGPGGQVVGVDSSAEAVEAARERVQRAALPNISFAQSDITVISELRASVAGKFDAIVGRFILQFVPDPVQVVQDLVGLICDNGILCFQEVDDWYAWSYPKTELWEQIRNWFLEALSRAGVEQRMGLRLYQIFQAAGLSSPTLRLEAPIGGGIAAPVSVWAGVVRAAIPAIERLGIANAAEIGADSLAERLMADIHAIDGVVIGPPMIGAWARVGI